MAASGSTFRAALAVALLISSAALAYVMPSSSILRRLVERRDDLRLSNLQVTGTATFPTEAAAEAGPALGIPGDREVQADATLSLKLPGRCRVELTVPEGTPVVSVSAHGKKRGEGKEIAAVNAALAQLCPVLALRSAEQGEAREGLERHLRSLGVDTKVTSLARYDGRIAYVIGKQDPAASQFWVYKDVFLPARVIYTDAQGTKWDVRLRNFGSPVAGDWFPRIIEVSRGDQLMMRFTALSADASAKLPDNLF